MGELMKLKTRLFLPFLMVFLIVGLTGASARKIKGEEIVKDGRQNAFASYYLWTQGRFATSDEVLNYKREPLPVAVTALHLAYFTDIPRDITPEQLTSEARYTRKLCRVNLFYVAALLASLWWLSWLLTRSGVICALAVIASWRFLVYAEGIMGNTNTELPMAVCMVLLSACSVLLVRRRSWSTAALTGVMLGAAALTKAAGLYVGLVAIPVLCLALIAFDVAAPRRAGTLLVFMIGGFLLVVTPWMLRNYIHFGDFAVAQRGGDVLLTRAVKNQMTSEEYRGSFYAYAPRDVRSILFEKMLGFHPEDLQPGGKYIRLIRDQPGDDEAAQAGDVEKAISYFAKTKAIKNKMEMELPREERTAARVDGLAQKLAMDMIKADPAKHLLTTITFAWRGLWSFNGSSNIVTAIANFLFFVVFSFFPVLAWLRGRPEWLAFSLFGFGMFWFYALLSHFIPRYSDPLIPLAILSGLLLVHDLISQGKSARG